MTDETEQPDSEQPAPGDVGAWLRSGRKAKGLTVEAVASALHLDASVVESLEREDFSKLGATVFVKGHLRAIAQHLGLDGEEAARRFNATAGDAADRAPDLIVSYNKPIRQSAEKLVWGIAALVLIIVILLAWLFWPSSPKSSSARPDVSLTDPVTSPVENPGAASESPTETGSAGPENDPGSDFAAMLETARSSSPTVATTSPPPVVRSERGLRISFNAECWYEVRDANGDRLAMGTAQAGTSRLITGARPFAVTLGVADAATLEVDGEPLTITSADRRGRAARLSIR